MPTYEFRCPNGHTFDQFHRISDAPSVASCPTCGAESVRAISGGAGLVFKGSGFYLTDYGKNAHRTSGPAKGGESGSSGGSESSGGEKSSGDKSSGDKSGAGSSGSEKSGSEKSSAPSEKSSSGASGGGNGGGTGGSSASTSSGGSSSKSDA
jgi:putative FmdB family regulatory protein